MFKQAYLVVEMSVNTAVRPTISALILCNVFTVQAKAVQLEPNPASALTRCSFGQFYLVGDMSGRDEGLLLAVMALACAINKRNEMKGKVQKLAV